MGERMVQDERPTGRELWESVLREKREGLARRPYVLGPYATWAQREDPKHNLFTLARYKFCGKMLAAKKRLLEAGCGDGLGFDLVLREGGPKTVTCVDFDQWIIADNQRRFAGREDVTFRCLDVTAERPEGRYDGAWSLDVIEHVYPEQEEAFLDHITAALEADAVFLAGTPNATAQGYASPQSAALHVNLKDAAGLRAGLEKRFRNVFLFSMNDEVVHTGFYPTAHYLLAMGVGVR